LHTWKRQEGTCVSDPLSDVIRMAAAARNSLYGYKHQGSTGVTALRILYKERTKG